MVEDPLGRFQTLETTLPSKILEIPKKQFFAYCSETKCLGGLRIFARVL
jgi:hypothetical protein